MNNFHSLKVVGRASETQLQVSENLNKLFSTLRVNIRDIRDFKGSYHRYLIHLSYK